MIDFTKEHKKYIRLSLENKSQNLYDPMTLGQICEIYKQIGTFEHKFGSKVYHNKDILAKIHQEAD